MKICKNESIYNSENLKIAGINFLIENIFFTKYIVNKKKILFEVINQIFTLSKKDNFEIVYIILIFNDLLKKEKNIVKLIEKITITNINNDFDFFNKLILLISGVFLIEGKYYDDLSMINIDYCDISDHLVNYKSFNLKKINQIENKLLNLLNFHFDLKHLDLFTDFSNSLLETKDLLVPPIAL